MCVAATMLLLLAAAAAAAGAAAAAPPLLFEGDRCQTRGGQQGECRLFESCRSALEDFQQRSLEPRRCSFKGSRVVVCCADPVPRLSPSQEACLSYSNEVPLRVNPLILGGTAADIGEFPHMAALGYVRSGSREVSWDCGGSLISDRYVLTAAHCASNSRRRLAVVRLGGTDLEARDDNSQQLAVDKVVPHPSYGKGYHDIALVRLAAAVRFATNVLPACLYREPEEPRRGLTVAGWGATDALGETKSRYLMKATVESVPLGRCNQTYARAGRALRYGVTADMVCAYDPDGVQDTCRGDSGGPLQTVTGEWSNMMSVVGVTSMGPALCGSSEPAVYTRVSSYVAWIEGVVWPQ
ncbi:serine protease snake-like [Bacillus rossius redtenbacheri]|uniref:serine protease snake-like n=1 Tax=Bacillus rossius redtenbacheri TaxID=93214 RepID=UPI002FDD780E